jgi:hypothetical protein
MNILFIKDYLKDKNIPVPPNPAVIRFNHSAAPALNGPYVLLTASPVRTTELQPDVHLVPSNIPAINMELFRAHLRYCLRYRVMGQGPPSI